MKILAPQGFYEFLAAKLEYTVNLKGEPGSVQFPVYGWLGPWRIHPHFLFEAIAYFVSFRLLLRAIRRDSLTVSDRGSIVVGGMVGALIGAKLLALLQHIDLLWQNRLLALQGKTVVGALLGGLIGVELTKRWIGVKESTGDVFVYPLIIGMAIGRVGCFLTGLDDRTYGTATMLPWGIDFGDGVMRHPTQLYEIAFLSVLLLALQWRTRLGLRSGDRFKLFMASYLGFRFLTDFIKPDFHPFLGISIIQAACILGLIYYTRERFYPFFKRSKI
jgi:phosphatidylglycerol---prolipoprotein diacylglyceryl transferase